jgi:hypothetical protein
MTPSVMMLVISPANLALDQAKRKSATEPPVRDGSIAALFLENMRQIALRRKLRRWRAFHHALHKISP